MTAFLYFSIIFLWGFTWIAIKIGLGVVPTEISVIYRFGLAAIILGVVLCVRGGRFKFSLKQHAVMALLGSLLFCTNFLFLYQASYYLTSGLVAIIFSTSVIMIMLNSIFFFKKKISANMIGGALLGFLGICCIFWPEIEDLNFSDATLIGLLLALIGTYSFSWGNQVSTLCTRLTIPLTSATFYGMTYGVIFMNLYCICAGIEYAIDFSPAYVLSILYLAIPGSVIGFLAYLGLVKRLTPERASYATLFFPLVALGVSTFIEDFHWVMEDFVGVVLILLGNALVLMKPRQVHEVDEQIKVTA